MTTKFCAPSAIFSALWRLAAEDSCCAMSARPASVASSAIWSRTNASRSATPPRGRVTRNETPPSWTASVRRAFASSVLPTPVKPVSTATRRWLSRHAAQISPATFCRAAPCSVLIHLRYVDKTNSCSLGPAVELLLAQVQGPLEPSTRRTRKCDVAKGTTSALSGMLSQPIGSTDPPDSGSMLCSCSNLPYWLVVRGFPEPAVRRAACRQRQLLAECRHRPPAATWPTAFQHTVPSRGSHAARRRRPLAPACALLAMALCRSPVASRVTPGQPGSRQPSSACTRCHSTCTYGSSICSACSWLASCSR